MAVGVGLALAAGGCGATTGNDDDGPTAAVAQPIQGGGLDTADNFRAVVAVYDVAGDRQCSGVLVTPRFVLTAAHCMGPSGGLEPAGQVGVLFGLHPADHTYPTYHHYPDYQGHAMALDVFSDDVEAGIDLALVKLAEPVPFRVARPVHPPRSDEVGVCGTGWIGVTTGFGRRLEACDLTEYPNNGYRQSILLGDWTRSDGPGTSEQFDRWSGPYCETPTCQAFGLGVCAQYEGPGKGDSGGGLFKIEPALGAWPYRLCGINSGDVASWVGGVAHVVNNAAAVDSAAATAWLEEHLIDVRGEWYGECAALRSACPAGQESSDACRDASSDSDVDGVPKACDSCSRFYNPDQLDIDDDPDGDGIGAACDLCPGIPFAGAEAHVSNCNYETELALSYPGETAPPLTIAPDRYPSDLDEYLTFEWPVLEAELHYLDAFALDACDPHPCPRQGFLLEDGWLPAHDVNCCLATDPSPSLDCNCSEDKRLIGYQYEWQIDNRVTLSPMAPMNGAAPLPWNVGADATVGLRWCPCPYDTRTLDGRVRCQAPPYNCTVDWRAYDPPVGGTGPWEKVRTYEAPGQVLSSLGKEWPLTLLSPSDGSAHELLWKFTALAPYLTAEYYELGTGVLGGPVYESVQGVLWASVVADWDGGEWKRYPHTYQAGNAQAWLSSAEPEWSSMRASGDWWLSRYCPHCPEGFTRMVERVNDPFVYEASPWGLVRAAGELAAVRDLDARAAAGELWIVEAAEPLGRIARPGADLVLRAVALDRASTTITRTVVQLGLDGDPFVQQGLPAVGSPVIEQDEGLVLSASLRQLFVIGGNAGGALGLLPEPSAWVLDVDENEWTELPLPAEERPGPVLGATYRMEDYALYLVDRRGGELVLDRWRPGGSVETLATLPSSWGELAKSWLVSGHAGDMLFAASTPAGAGAASSLLARFTVDHSGVLGFAGMVRRPGALLGAPVLTARGMSLIVDDPSGGSLETIETSVLGPPPADDTPTVVGWPAEPLVALESAWLAPGSRLGGDLVVRAAAPGGVLADGAELVVGPRALIEGSATADTLRLEPKSRIDGNAAFNELVRLPRSLVRGELVTPLALPLGGALPLLPSWPVGGDDIEVEAGSQVLLPPGGYGALVLRGASADDSAVVTLGQGRYGLESLVLEPNTRLECAAPCEVRVAGHVEAMPHSYIGPVAPGVRASDVVLLVEGWNGSGGCPRCEPLAVALGPASELMAYTFVPNGTTRLGARARAKGRLVGRHVWLEAGSALNAD